MRKDAVDKASIEKAASMVRKEADKALSGAKELASEENIEKVKDFAKSLGTSEGREKAAESARQAAKASKIWFLAFWDDVKTHFKPNENLSGFAALKSRFANLWLCGLNGKIAIIAFGLIAVSTVKMTMSGDSVDCNFSGYTDSTGVVIKGLYAGMSKKSCIKQMEYLAKKYKLSCSCEDNKNGSTSVYLKSKVEWSGKSYEANEMEAEINAQGTTTDIEFKDGAINRMFNAGDMTLKQFAQALVNNYNIPSLEPSQKKYETIIETIYHYEDSKGRSVNVSQSTVHSRGAGIFDGMGIKSLTLSYRQRTFD